MNPAISAAFVGGVLAAGYLVLGLFFLRFWSRTRDGLFVSFAAAFGLMALGQTAVVLLGLAEENRDAVYILRLLAFGLIIAAILRKNFRAG